VLLVATMRSRSARGFAATATATATTTTATTTTATTTTTRRMGRGRGRGGRGATTRRRTGRTGRTTTTSPSRCGRAKGAAKKPVTRWMARTQAALVSVALEELDKRNLAILTPAKQLPAGFAVEVARRLRDERFLDRPEMHGLFTEAGVVARWAKYLTEGRRQAAAAAGTAKKRPKPNQPHSAAARKKAKVEASARGKAEEDARLAQLEALSAAEAVKLSVVRLPCTRIVDTPAAQGGGATTADEFALAEALFDECGRVLEVLAPHVLVSEPCRALHESTAHLRHRTATTIGGSTTWGKLFMCSDENQAASASPLAMFPMQPQQLQLAARGEETGSGGGDGGGAGGSFGGGEQRKTRRRRADAPKGEADATAMMVTSWKGVLVKVDRHRAAARVKQTASAAPHREHIGAFRVHPVGRCRLTVSKPELKARVVSALETKM
jgi:hypothetical protein